MCIWNPLKHKLCKDPLKSPRLYSSVHVALNTAEFEIAVRLQLQLTHSQLKSWTGHSKPDKAQNNIMNTKINICPLAFISLKIMPIVRVKIESRIQRLK